MELTIKSQCPLDSYTYGELKAGRDVVGLIADDQSKRGTGKTTAGATFCKKYDPTFNLDRVIFTPNHLLKIASKLTKETPTPGTFYLCDEIELTAEKRRSMGHDAVNLLQLLSTLRATGVSIIATCPSTTRLDKGLKEFADFIIYTNPSKIGTGKAYRVHVDKWNSDVILYDWFSIKWDKIDDTCPWWKDYEQKKLEFLTEYFTKQLRKQGLIKKERGPTKADKIRELLLEHPTWKQVDIAKAADASIDTVSKVKRRSSPV